jgi:dTDP-4-dehydrorhamnose 3,5-epimerase
MIFRKTRLKGVWRIQLEPRSDERGYFVRTYCEREFAENGLNTCWRQCNLTLTKLKGMVRGLHFQAEPHPEIKLVRCTTGAIYDVVVDVRPDSSTYGQWEGFELTPATGEMLYISAGFAHGFQTLQDDSMVFYQMSDFYFPELARGIRWNDPALGIIWPLESTGLSPRDQTLPFLAESRT